MLNADSILPLLTAVAEVHIPEPSVRVSGAVFMRIHPTNQRQRREGSSQQFPRITIGWRSLGL